MGLAPIGAGFGRTGTASLKIALEQLGLGRCYPMLEVFANPAQAALWHAAASNPRVAWEGPLAGYPSTVDWPATSGGSLADRDHAIEVFERHNEASEGWEPLCASL